MADTVVTADPVVKGDAATLDILARDRLRIAPRDDRPRLGLLEIEMDSALRPRDIQARIRAGQSIEEVANLAEMPIERVEIFAGPVLAERGHVARQAIAATVRRRGETSGHRQLGTTLIDRLASRQIDDETLDWDSAKMDDGRWSVTATFDTGEAQRQAIFYFDLRGRFSVAANDEARWALGEQSAAHSAQSGSSPGDLDPFDPDNEPTVDLSDELALVRATQDRKRRAATETAEDESAPRELHLVDDQWDAEEEAAYAELQQPAETEEEQAEFDQERADQQSADQDSPADEETAPEVGATEQAPDSRDESDQQEPEPVEPQNEGTGDLGTLYEMLGGDGYSEDSVRVYSGLSDASAVPETDNAGWEPAITVDYPVEPSLLDDEEEHLFSDQPEIMGTVKGSPNSPQSPTAEVSEARADEAATAVEEAEVEEATSRTTAREQETGADESPESTSDKGDQGAVVSDSSPESASTPVAQPQQADPVTPPEAAKSTAPSADEQEADGSGQAAETAGLSRAARRRKKRKEARKATASEPGAVDAAPPEPSRATGQKDATPAAPAPADSAPADSAPAAPVDSVQADAPEHSVAEDADPGDGTPQDAATAFEDAATEDAATEDRPSGEAMPTPADATAESPVAATQEQKSADSSSDPNPAEEQPKPKKPAKRKRASVPSWDEIMFGGPPRKGGSQ